ncbi:MAG TPA: hypothetical protein VJ044_07690 [Candidatus Hodarchaeales archaeon]|nr:hypothetical protein [Candidatus Hodarchaeales archaeon]
MSSELWIFIGTVLVSLITLSGIVYTSKANVPYLNIKALKDTVDTLSAENTRLSEKIDRMQLRIDELESQVKKYEGEVTLLYAKLGRRGER